MDDDIIDKLSRDTYYCWGCVEWGCTACDCDCHGWEGTHAAAKAEIERLRAAGDALAEFSSEHYRVLPTYYLQESAIGLIRNWKEARRG